MLSTFHAECALLWVVRVVNTQCFNHCNIPDKNRHFLSCQALCTIANNRHILVLNAFSQLSNSFSAILMFRTSIFNSIPKCTRLNLKKSILNRSYALDHRNSVSFGPLIRQLGETVSTNPKGICTAKLCAGRRSKNMGWLGVKQARTINTSTDQFISVQFEQSPTLHQLSLVLVVTSQPRLLRQKKG